MGKTSCNENPDHGHRSKICNKNRPSERPTDRPTDRPAGWLTDSLTHSFTQRLGWVIEPMLCTGCMERKRKRKEQTNRN